jgi:hypothetical protein
MSTHHHPPGSSTDAPTIEAMFERAFAQCPQSTFLSSIYSWWEERQFLTKSQMQALAKFAREGCENELDFD